MLVRACRGVLPPQPVPSATSMLSCFGVHVQVLPAYEPVPSYKTWVYLKRNELAQETGRTMFYTDAAGELAGEAAFFALQSQ